MNMEEKIKKIEEEKKKKYLIPPSKQIFHCGIIMLVSLVIGRISVQIGYEVNPSVLLDDEKLNAIDQLHRVYGNFLGLIIGTVGGVPYLIWTGLRASKYHKEVKEETNILKEKVKK
ncbi:hypothetical protein [Candidatus Methylobacter oryzae]|uniref:Uncharacterized protein n=1 Tax=Candidatus Methylobacter oryzae TaxID=2497749 RepID=A0ABY3CCU8_9GAMM|nr:hypothetical protein [Candidatus Methylobacter oryzae]TRX00308.1 hypothetical protein EKO24_006175 [Candidatus Methylobacter oryzae]